MKRISFVIKCYKILPESERKNLNKIVKGVLVLKGWFKIHLNLIYSVNKTFVRIKRLWNNWKRGQSNESVSTVNVCIGLDK